jgi:conflict system pore-forming effector with SLATT domain
MSTRDDQLTAFYRRYRIDDQLGFYAGRGDLFDRAAGQALVLAAVFLGFTSAVSALAGADVAPIGLWGILATALPAVSTALAAYSTLYAFDQQSKIYADASRALRATTRPVPVPEGSPPPGPADVVQRVEAVLRQEQAQWGQLTAAIEIPDSTKS